MTSTEVLNSKNKIHDKIKLITDFKALWEQDLETKRFKLIVEGFFMEKGMGPSGLTEADWQRIEGLFTPINNRLTNIENRLDVLEQDVAELKNDMSNVKEDIKVIKECPTIQKEIKKD